MVITESCECKEVDVEVKEGDWVTIGKQCTKCWKEISLAMIESKQTETTKE